MAWRQKILYRKYLLFYTSIFIFFLIFCLALFFYLSQRLKTGQTKSVSSSLSSPQPEVSRIPEIEVPVLEKPVTILILGLDARRGDYRPRCDAIHLVTFSPPEEKIIITSVPRGIPVNLPNVATPSAYLGNSCHLMGIDWAVSVIEKITKIHPDHLIKINFSQTIGILRFLNLPTTPALQFLRNRKSYLIGDPQRSHNQALFIKDMILKHLDQVANLPQPVKYLLFKMVKTDSLDFETTNLILNWMAKNNFSQKPKQIELLTKPGSLANINDIHFVESEFPNKDAWQNDKEFQAYQEELTTYLQNLKNQAEIYFNAGNSESCYLLLNTPFSQQLWLQLEDDQVRNSFHFDLLKLYVLSLPNDQKASEIIQDFIKEMEIVKDDELKKKAEELLESL